MITTIQVTKDDIKKGARKDIANNPAALALRRTFWEAKEIVVNLHYFRIDGRTYDNPSVLYDFIFEWDLGLVVKPIEFIF